MSLKTVLKNIPIVNKSYHSVKNFKNKNRNLTKTLVSVKLEQYADRLRSGKIIDDNKIGKPISYEHLSKFQSKIDSMSYPPTHQYLLHPFKPVGTTHVRLEKIKLLDSRFFTGTNFLDIGSNKGFFSLLARQSFDQIVAIENDNEFADLIKSFDLGIEVENKTFRDFTTDMTFDKIMIGNVAHYLYNESGWDWIAKLAVLSTGRVLIEGAINMKCNDMKIAIPKAKQSGYGEFLNEMKKYFRLVRATSSISPDRYVMLWERIGDEFTNIVQYKKMDVKKVIKTDEHQMVIDLGNEVAKINKMKTTQWFPISRNKINMARLSPISNGLSGIVEKNGKFVGWTETKLDEEENNYKEDQEKIFKLICKHQIFLARNGYVDCDSGSINFFKNGQLFDKGMVIPIKDMRNEIVDNYITYLNQSFDIELLVQEKIIYALRSKDSRVIEHVFEQLGRMKWQ